jgi:hypothetical protein
MKILVAAMSALLCMLIVAAAEIQPVMDTVVTDQQGGGCIDWTARVIYARGIGAPNMDVPEAARRPGAIRAAQQVAMRDALETLKGIYLNSTTTVENFMVKSDVITSHIGGFLKGFEQKGKEKYMSDGSVEVIMAIPLDGIGGSGDQIFGTSIGEKPSVTSWEAAAPKKQTVFSGLIIDCKGLKIKPALSPRVLDESGREVYGSAYVSRDWAIKYGIAGYSREVKEAAKLDRIGKTPGRIKAIKASGENSTDIVISDADAAEVRSAGQNLTFLSECRVIFVVD